ncbi:MAG: DNA polymerase [Opitutaceae bacterium]|jgi:DNA polymerase elongation subunit (family B)|nr:DNA polymerase [Opitutaceae bacterium]
MPDHPTTHFPLPPPPAPPAPPAPSAPPSLCGLWIAADGIAHLALARPDGTREERTDTLRPFAWLTVPTTESPDLATERATNALHIEPLAGDAVFNRLVHADTLPAFDAFVKTARAASGAGIGVDVIRPAESQYLLQHRQRLFRDISFSQVRRCQIDIETASHDGEFSDATKPGDHILAIGLRFNYPPPASATEHRKGNPPPPPLAPVPVPVPGPHPAPRTRLLVLEAMTDAAEKKLLEELNTILAAEDPDFIEGHNLFKFDLDYLRRRARRHKVPCAWGRFGQPATFRNSRLKVAERWIDFPRCDLPGRTVVDTWLLIQHYDITTRELTSYGLKDVALYFGITDETTDRTYIEGARIQETFHQDRDRFLAYLADDLRETQGIADLLLPTYFEQIKTFPILPQEAILRGITNKIDLLFLENYYHARQTIPAPPETRPFEGGYTRNFREGVYRHILHFDVASLYPSLLLAIGRNPRNDTLGVFIPLLRNLREYRLRYKQHARTAPTPDERAEAQARQASFKILINSFYGYLGFSGARFGDGDLAAEVTRRGRELLQTLIDAFAAEGCTILEADTDGIYLSTPRYHDHPETLLEKITPHLPPGIELEYDGRYEAMFCYKTKNYALYDGETQKIILRGSALRSRGTEPYLRRLGTMLIHFLLGASTDSPLDEIARLRDTIGRRDHPVTDLAKSEVLGQNPDAYELWINNGGKPRRPAAEAARQLTPRPRMGERIAYYITPRAPGRTSDWQRARPVALHDAETAPYDASYYLEKIDDWLDRYGPFLGVPPAGGGGIQGELF